MLAALLRLASAAAAASATGGAAAAPGALTEGAALGEGAGLPHGLLTSFQASPALGVPAKPQFTWVVPAGGEPDHAQASYRIVVTDAADAKKSVWDSGVVQSAASVGVEYGGPVLLPGAAYNWTVATTTAAGSQLVPRTSAPSEPATFITALHGGFDKAARYIWTDKETGGMFAFLRKTVPRPSAKIVRATAFITAVTDDYMLCGYKLYLGGQLVNVGPGRGEAPIWGGNGTYMDKPYQTLDVTPFLPATGDLLVAIQGLGSSGKGGPACAGPCAGIGPKLSAGVLMQLTLELEGGGSTLVSTDASWDAFDADLFMRPSPGKNWYKHVLESTDAQQEPVGWRSEPTFKASGTGWSKATEVLAAAGVPGLHPKMARPIESFDVPAPKDVVKMDPSEYGEGW